MNLIDLKSLFVSAGCNRLYAKLLAENDNSKNQIYFGPDFSALSLFPNQGIISDGNTFKPIYKAKLDFWWISATGVLTQAQGAKLILYPQYPEVRFSGFLQGCRESPSKILNARLKNRVLFMGVTAHGTIVGFVADGESDLSAEYRLRHPVPSIGVFTELILPLPGLTQSPRSDLLKELRRIHELGWISSKRLSREGIVLPCNAPNCGGYTLEAELGVTPNGRSEPDYLGFEVKQTAVPNFDRLESGIITLMTPEPTGGIYSEEGPEKFVREFGYADKKGREDRLNFGGIFRVDKRHEGTKLTLKLLGYNNGKVTDKDASIALLDDGGRIAASWDFRGLMQHWARKHAHAVYVPSMMRKEPSRGYRYSKNVRLAEQPEFIRLLNAFNAGVICYDPGIKLENASSSKPKIKLRSQFRIKSRDIPVIYGKVEMVDVVIGE
jgi:hypothetical protein